MSVIASRVLKCRVQSDLIEVPVRVLQPESVPGGWLCRYQIEWPNGRRAGYGSGVDAVQALLIALMNIGAELYASEYHERGELYWTKPGDGFGFPVAQPIRDLLVGSDRIGF